MGVPITGTITPYPNGTYATTDPLTGIDSWRSVDTIATRNAITSLRRRQGMICVVQADTGGGPNIPWQLTAASPWAFDDSDWTQLFTLSIGLRYIASCRVATAAALTATYANGTLGVGATLTNADTQAAIAIDGVTLALTDRVLVKDQAAPAQNGIYTATTLGDGSHNWVLTRATDYDQTAEVVEGTYTVIVEGTVNNETLWVETQPSPITIGSTSIVFTQLKITGLGTVTSVATGTGLTGGPITTTGTVSIAAGGVGTTQLAAAGVTYAKLQNEGVVSLLGNPTGSPAAPSEITLGAGLSFSGTTLVATNSGSVTSITAGSGLSGGTITSTGTIAISAPVSVANGGTGDITLTAHAVLLGEGTSAVAFATIGTSGRLLLDQGAAADPSFKAMSGDATITNLGVVAIAAGTITYAKLQVETAHTLLGNPTGSDAVPSEITLGSGLAFSGSTLTATGSGGSVTSVSVVTANGVSGTVATATTTPAITLTLGAITPTSVAASGAVTGSNLSGTNTGNQTISLTGDVTGSGTGSFGATIAAHAVVYAKMQLEGAHTLLGNPTSGSAVPSEIALGAGLSFSGSTLVATTTGTVSSVATGTGLTGGTITSTGTISIAVGGVGTVQLAVGAVTYANIQAVAAHSLLGNPTGSSAAPSAITLGAGLAFSGSTLVASVEGGPVASWLLGPDTPLAVGSDIAINWYPVLDGTISGALINAKGGASPTGPVGADLIVDIKLSADSGSTWTSLWHATPANRPTIADGDTVGTAGTPDTTSRGLGDLLRVDIIQVGSTTPGSNVSLVLY